MEEWLNDTTVDGFLGNLRDYEKFIKLDSKWNATEDSRDLGEITRHNETTIVEDPVGLLNIYEYQTSYKGTTYNKGYLNNSLYWWSITPVDATREHSISDQGTGSYGPTSHSIGIRPSINLKANIKIIDGNGTEENPYRLEGDNDTNLKGTLLKDRYSGEYLTFGTGENTIYRIVSHENGRGTKITSAEPLKKGTFIDITFGSDAVFSSNNTIGSFLNGEYLTNYIDATYNNMIEESTIWYLGTIKQWSSYRLAKYTDTTMASLTNETTMSKVGLLRLGELMAGQFNENENNMSYWTITPYSSTTIRRIDDRGRIYSNSTFDYSYGIKPALNLKQNVVITSGDGTKNNPFQIELQ